MTVANVAKEFQGVFANDQADPVADTRALLMDGVWSVTSVVDSAAGTDFTYVSIVVPFAVKIIAINIAPTGALTGADATANTYTAGKSNGLGGAITAMGTHVTNLAGGNWAADVLEPFTLTAANCDMTLGQLLTIKKTHAGAGTATPQAAWNITYRKI
jgi:hypothetical protein